MARRVDDVCGRTGRRRLAGSGLLIALLLLATACGASPDERDGEGTAAADGGADTSDTDEVDPAEAADPVDTDAGAPASTDGRVDTSGARSDTRYELMDAPCSTFDPSPFDALFPGDMEVFVDQGEPGESSFNPASMHCHLTAEDTYLYKDQVSMQYRIHTDPGQAFQDWQSGVTPERISDADPYDAHPVDGRPWTHAGITTLDLGGTTSTVLAVLDGNLVLRASIDHPEIDAAAAGSILDGFARESITSLQTTG